MLINRENPHGGDIYTNNITLDFSSNVNPSGMPEAVGEALRDAVINCTHYPDPYCRELREKISAREKIPADRILCGNGAAELIYSFAYSLSKDKPALIVSPTFSEYQTALDAAGIAAELYILDEKENFVLNGEILTVDFSKYGAVFLCTPNNPTGITIDPDLLVRMADTGAKLFCDMCFLDLTDFPERYDIPGMTGKYPNLVILKAFTKSFALAGLRLGYVLCSDAELLEKMSRKAPCWNVSVPAQAAGCAAIDCGGFLSDSVRIIGSERARLTETLRSAGIKVYTGEANFLLLYSECDLYDRLFERGILVRDCSNYAGLQKGFIRIAVRTPEENDRLLSAMKEVLM